MQKNLQKGFTLIEVIIYLGLFGILMAGSLVAAVNLFEASGRDTTSSMLQAEGEFLLGKVAWALSGTQSVNSPAAGHIGSVLSVNKTVGLDADGTPLVQSVTLDLDPSTNTDMRLSEGSMLPARLNNTNVSLSYLGFYHATTTGTGITPESVGVRFVLTVHTPSGATLEREFFATSSIRQ